MYDTIIILLAISVGYTTGKQVGVSLVVNGVLAPNNSLVDIEDVLFVRSKEFPTNNRPHLHDRALLCITDLTDCCETRNLGNWYYPDGRIVKGGGYLRNRGQNELRYGRQFYGSVRIYRASFSRHRRHERGRFRCELPDANNVIQTLYANIVDFGINDTIGTPTVVVFDSRGSPVSSPQPSVSSTAGETGFSLMCATILVSPVPLPSSVPTPTFQWFFGPNGNGSLPSGVTPPITTSDSDIFAENSILYSSILEFPQMSQRVHSGMYTCRIGAGRLANQVNVNVNDPTISVVVNPGLKAELIVGQTGTTLTCDVFGADNLNPTITYQWIIKDNVTSVRSDTLTLSPLQLSHAGVYTCIVSVIISSTYLNNIIQVSANNSEILKLQIPNPQSVAVTSSDGSYILDGSNITVTCTVELGPSVMSESDLSLITVEAQLFRDGNELNQTSHQIDGFTHTFSVLVSSFNESDNGDYSCSATVSPHPSSSYLIGIGQGTSNTFPIVVGIPPTTQSVVITGTIAGSVVVVVALAALTVTIVAFFFLHSHRRRHLTVSNKQSTRLNTNEL